MELDLERKKLPRGRVLYIRVQEQNNRWIKKQLVKFGYNPKHGKSEFLDNLFTELRTGILK